MTILLDDTHAPGLQSWIEPANAPDADFPVQNLPFGVFTPKGRRRRRVGIAIGDAILDVNACARAGFLGTLGPALDAACGAESLNALFALGRPAARRLRQEASRLLRADTRDGNTPRARRDEFVHAMATCRLHLPAEVGDYTDFYASVHHATNVGSMFRPDNPLLPNYKWVPIGYHGRASSLVASGTPVRRPSGQTRPDPDAAPQFGPARSLDYELEVGAFVAQGNPLGTAVSLAHADEHLFGLCLVNDWSARDIQSWEYQPLGPFLAKSFATTVSPWVVTLEALAPFRVAAAPRAAGDPAPLPYLDDPADTAGGAFDITLEVLLSSAAMRRRGDAPLRVSAASFREMYWTLGQMLAHHTSNGCNLRPGDLIASGTVSGPLPESRGCLLERTWRGSQPLLLPGGETRAFLADGDEVTLRAWCERAGARRIGFGECRGVVLAARGD